MRKMRKQVESIVTPVNNVLYFSLEDKRGNFTWLSLFCPFSLYLSIFLTGFFLHFIHVFFSLPLSPFLSLSLFLKHSLSSSLFLFLSSLSAWIHIRVTARYDTLDPDPQCALSCIQNFRLYLFEEKRKNLVFLSHSLSAQCRFLFQKLLLDLEKIRK